MTGFSARRFAENAAYNERRRKRPAKRAPKEPLGCVGSPIGDSGQCTGVRL